MSIIFVIKLTHQQEVIVKKFICASLLVIFAIFGSVSNAYSQDKNIKISGKMFSIELPAKAKGLFSVKKDKNTISIYDKQSKKAGFGGFAFGIRAYKSPADHAMLPGARKLGELKDKNGVLYDIVLKQPTDVQYDYVTGNADSYKLLYDLADSIDSKINGIKKSAYYNHQGTKGKDLYNDVLKKHLTAIEEKWDSIKLEKENMSYMYNLISSSEKNPLEKIGYIYFDANGDGIDELLIGEIAQGSWKGVVYDIYTMENRKPVHVVSGGSRNRYFVCDGTFLCNEYSSGAEESGVRVYIIVENKAEIYPQVGFKYDAYENKSNPWFVSYDFENDKWESYSEKEYKERKSVFEKYERFDFIPFSTLK